MTSLIVALSFLVGMWTGQTNNASPPSAGRPFILNATGWGSLAAAGPEEAFGNTARRQTADFTGKTRIRVGGSISVASNTTWKMGLQYSINGGSSFQDFDGAKGPFVAVGNTTLTVFTGSIVNIPAAAQIQSVLLRMVGIDGTGANTPTVLTFWFEALP